MAVHDALSRETMDKDVNLCHRCLDAVQYTVEKDDGSVEGRDVLKVEELLAAQAESYGYGDALLKDDDCIKDEAGLLCKVFGNASVTRKGSEVGSWKSRRRALGDIAYRSETALPVLLVAPR
jgi:hypothetical protein